jgi:hypothetical protein
MSLEEIPLYYNGKPWFEPLKRVLSDVSILLVHKLGVTVARVYRQLYRHCSEPLEHMAPVDRSARARETVHIYGGTRDGART